MPLGTILPHIRGGTSRKEETVFDVAFFISVAQHHGHPQHTAQRAYHTIIQQLRNRQGDHGTILPNAYYLYRTGGDGGGDESREGTQRTRTLVAFPSADAALAFAQLNHLGPTPRLVQLSIARLLALLVQRPAILALIFADEPDETFRANTLPLGLRLERTMLLDLLKEESA